MRGNFFEKSFPRTPLKNFRKKDIKKVFIKLTTFLPNPSANPFLEVLRIPKELLQKLLGWGTGRSPENTRKVLYNERK